tara:strand:- start:17 stop:148 length:132 start_codon:yes stop_codon:yes gene_type:complete
MVFVVFNFFKNSNLILKFKISCILKKYGNIPEEAAPSHLFFIF